MYLIATAISYFRRRFVSRITKECDWDQEGKIILNHLLFADDLAICAGSQEDLQSLLDVVYLYSCKWRFKFNIAKSNIMIVSGKRQQGLQPEYFLGLDTLKIVKTYKYLGLDFEDTLRWTLTRQRLVAKAKGRLAMLSKALSEGLSMKAAEVIWCVDDCTLAPSYGEQQNAKRSRRLLGVSNKMTNAVVRGELGWWPMRAQRDMKLLLYWARLVRLDDSRLAKQVYRSRREQAEKRISDWCSHVHRTLMSIGLGHIWDSEEVGSENDWKNLLKARIQAREEKEWLEEMAQLPKLRTYRKLKLVLKKEDYLTTILDREERRRMTALRGGTHPLRVETGRWRGELLEHRTCTFCAKGEIEDEAHVLLCCSTYERERSELYRSVQSSTNYDLRVMSSDRELALKLLLAGGCLQRRKRLFVQSEVAKFVAAMFRKRTRLLERIQL